MPAVWPILICDQAGALMPRQIANAAASVRMIERLIEVATTCEASSKSMRVFADMRLVSEVTEEATAGPSFRRRNSFAHWHVCAEAICIRSPGATRDRRWREGT